MKSLEVISAERLSETEAIIPSDSIYSGALSASTEDTVSVPTGADFAVFMCTRDFYVNYDLTAAVPTGSLSQAGGELNPYIRNVTEISTIHVISEYACKLTIAFYSK